MNIKTNVKKRFFDFVVVNIDDGEKARKMVLHIEAETEQAARMLIPKNYRIVEKDEEV